MNHPSEGTEGLRAASGEVEDPRAGAEEPRGPAKAGPGSPDVPSVPLELVTTPAADRLMDELAAKLGVGKPDVLSMGLALLKIATDARSEGKRLAIIDEAGNVAREVEL